MACVNVKASVAPAAEDALPMIAQLRKLRGLPKRIETTTNAIRSRQSMPVMMNRPMSALAMKYAMLSRQYSAAMHV